MAYRFPFNRSQLTARDLLFLALVQGEAAASASRMITVTVLTELAKLVDEFETAQDDAQSPPVEEGAPVVGQAPDQAPVDVFEDATPRAEGLPPRNPRQPFAGADEEPQA